MYSPDSAAAIRANLDGSAISTYVLFMLIVPLKFWCRLQSGHKKLGWDDYLTGMGAITTNTFFYITMIGESTLILRSMANAKFPQVCESILGNMPRHLIFRLSSSS